MLGGVVFSTLRTPTCRGRHRALQPAAIERVIWIGSKNEEPLIGNNCSCHLQRTERKLPWNENPCKTTKINSHISVGNQVKFSNIAKLRDLAVLLSVLDRKCRSINKTLGLL